MITIEQCIKFIREHGILEGWTDAQICSGINLAIQNCAITFTEENGNLTGLVFGRWIDDFTFHVTAIAGKGKLKDFFTYLRRVFPNCHRIEAVRYGLTKIYNI